MAKNLRAGLRQSIKASRKAGVTGAGIFSLAPLDLRFALQKTLDPRVTFTRASTGTYVGSDGLVKTATTNEARFDHNPTTGESLGLLVEEARTNLLLNSATLSTQSVTVAAAANTLSFYGTGTVTLTGVSTAGPLVGTGANNRVSLTFTPTAGVLVLTVSGSVTNAQVEAGAFPTSYIPTTTATVTRAADVASITGTNFSSWYNQTEGTVFAEYKRLVNASGRIFTFNDTTANEQIRITASLSTNIRPDWQVIDGGAVQANVLSTAEVAVGATGKTAGAYKLNDFQQATNSTLGTADTAGTLPTLTVLNIGANETGSGSMINGTIKRLTYWPVRLANPTLQAITSP